MMGKPTEDSIKKYKEDVQDMVDELLANLDKHTYENNYTLYGDHLIYPMIVTTLVDGDNYGDVYMGGTTSGDLWDTFIDNLSRDYDGDVGDYLGIRSDQYHQLTKLNPYDYDHFVQSKMIDLYCFAYNLEWDFTHEVWEIAYE
tara:strand:+ start:56 stop:484 length:429 start_codon:yes stop_codon:yes gene_type:complete